VYANELVNDDCVLVKDLGIFVFFTNHTSGARDLFDSVDEQRYYSVIWGQGTAHLGRYTGVKLSSDPIVLSSQVVNAQNLFEEEFCAVVRQKIEHCDGVPIPCRFLDLGCGYGGLLRKFRDYGFLRHGEFGWAGNVSQCTIKACAHFNMWCGIVLVGVGVDFSARMCQQCVQNNVFSGMDSAIEVRNESYLDTSLDAEVVDVCVSMESFLHVGVERHRQVLLEAYRVLRPGGWLLFSDIMECPHVDPEEMRPFYERLNVSKLGSVTSYTKIAEEVGFRSISYVSHSEDVCTHYDAINRMVVAYRRHPDPAKRLDVSQEFYEYLEQSIRGWAELAAGRIEWGIFVCRKV
jgi:SAM-dependent methyltransferase